MTALEKFLESCDAVPDHRVTFAEFRQRFEQATGERLSNYALSRALRQRFPVRPGGGNVRYVHGVKFRPTAEVPANRISYADGYHYLNDAGQWERTTFAQLREKLGALGCDDASVRDALYAARR